jgi:predicted ester cyclase
MHMNATAIRTAIESFYADLWNRQDESRIPLLLDPDLTFRASLGGTKKGHAGFATYLNFVHDRIASFRCDILDIVIEPPKAFARLRFSGLHRGELFGFQGTGRPIEWLGAALFTFLDKRVVDLWVLGDVNGLLPQLRTSES